MTGIVLALLWMVMARGQEPGTRTVWDKVYTAAQAARGKDAYMADCAACHGEDLGGGGYAPALLGEEFTVAWRNKTVGDFIDQTQKSMPPESPGSLSAAKYRDITAFLLQENKFPSGDRELDTDLTALRQIKIAPKP
jgi:mono/diheme cytochrome c family protein